MNDWLLHHARDIAIEKAAERMAEWLFRPLRKWVKEWLYRVIVGALMRPFDTIAEILVGALNVLVISVAVAAFLAMLLVCIQTSRRAA
jgi:hypothetical protein